MPVHQPWRPSAEGHAPQLHIYTGDGKGKTTAAIGLAIRALGRGLRVDFIQFDKGFEDEEHYNERKILRALPNLRFEASGLERMRPEQKFRFGVTDGDRAEAQRALRLAEERVFSGDADLVILDEAISAAQYKLLERETILNLAERFRAERPRELVLTGRGAWPALLERADLVTEMKAVKHYFDAGIPARPGIDY
jgi:cob(I)alamin adenosyltransferase